MGIPEAAPARLGRYELVARIASGGMGEIFLARLEGAAGFEKLFVIKRILPHLADDVRFRAMLIAEARIASVMTHANLCQVYELGETEGQLYIVMEYLEGVTALPLLHKMSKEGRPLDLGFVSGVIQQAIDGIHYAHELKDRAGEYLGIVHRDVTPSNIFLTDAGIVKILDFGIAKVKDASAHTQTGTVKGKYAYMSPEQLRGAAIDRRADVFALGIVLFEMLALRRLFQRKTDYLTFRAVMEQPIPDVRHYRPDCPPALAAVLARALDRDPEQRFATARQFGSAVLEAASAARRPWTQGEIGDFVSANFGQDLQKRGAQIATVVGVGGAGTPLPVPMIIEADEPADSETEDEFPPVDSTLSNRPPPPPDPLRSVSGEHGAIGEAVTRLDAPIPLRGRTSQQQAVIDLQPASPAPRRSLVWPFVAIAMVAVAGGALFLVWRQMQNQPPTQIVFTSGSGARAGGAGSDVIEVGPAPVAPEPAASPEPAPAEPRGNPPLRISPARSAAEQRAAVDAQYQRVVLGRRAEAEACTTAHGNPPRDTQLVILAGADGRPTSLEFVPASIAATPFGACIKAAFATARFPRGEPGHQVTVNFHAR
jgi:serine/threonine protein kinase